MRSEPIRLLLADDHPLIIRGLVELFGNPQRYEIVATCVDGPSALSSIRSADPEIAVLDIHMPGLSGLEILIAIKQEGVATRTVLLAATLEGEQAAMAIRAGARGILLKSQAPEELEHSVALVASGGCWFPQEILASAEQASARLAAQASFAGALTSREEEVCRLAAKGCSNKAIARELEVSAGTIKIHLHNAFRKLGVGSRVMLAYHLFRGQR
jgi:two-component system, NarL family, nitrate/nitrite response regulator NarL